MNQKGAFPIVLIAIIVLVGLVIYGLKTVPELRNILGIVGSLGKGMDRLVSIGSQVTQKTGGEMFIDSDKIEESCQAEDIKPFCKLFADEAKKQGEKRKFWTDIPSGVDELKERFGTLIDVDKTLEFCNTHYPSLFDNSGEEDPVKFYFCSSEAFQQSEIEGQNKPYIVNLGRKGYSTKFVELKGFKAGNDFTTNLTVFKPSEVSKNLNVKIVKKTDFDEKMKAIRTEPNPLVKLEKYLLFFNEFNGGFDVIFSDSGAFVEQPLSIFVSPAVKTTKLEVRDKKLQYYATSFVLVLSQDFVNTLNNTDLGMGNNFFNQARDKIVGDVAEKTNNYADEEENSETFKVGVIFSPYVADNTNIFVKNSNDETIAVCGGISQGLPLGGLDKFIESLKQQFGESKEFDPKASFGNCEIKVPKSNGEYFLIFRSPEEYLNVKIPIPANSSTNLKYTLKAPKKSDIRGVVDFSYLGNNVEVLQPITSFYFGDGHDLSFEVVDGKFLLSSDDEYFGPFFGNKNIMIMTLNMLLCKLT